MFIPEIAFFNFLKDFVAKSYTKWSRIQKHAEKPENRKISKSNKQVIAPQAKKQKKTEFCKILKELGLQGYAENCRIWRRDKFNAKMIAMANKNTFQIFRNHIFVKKPKEIKKRNGRTEKKHLLLTLAPWDG